jgi:hypothetical protein
MTKQRNATFGEFDRGHSIVFELRNVHELTHLIIHVVIVRILALGLPDIRLIRTGTHRLGRPAV